MRRTGTLLTGTAIMIALLFAAVDAEAQTGTHRETQYALTEIDGVMGGTECHCIDAKITMYDDHRMDNGTAVDRSVLYVRLEVTNCTGEASIWTGSVLLDDTNHEIVIPTRRDGEWSASVNRTLTVYNRTSGNLEPMELTVNLAWTGTNIRHHTTRTTHDDAARDMLVHVNQEWRPADLVGSVTSPDATFDLTLHERTRIIDSSSTSH